MSVVRVSQDGHSSTPDVMAGPSFAGLRVLIIEDESIVTMLIEDTLSEIGCTVAGIASTLEEALERAASLDVEVAILDVNLNGVPTYPVAELLIKKLKPFVFATGYGIAGVPTKFRHVPILSKPFQLCDVENALRRALICQSARPW